MSETPETPSGEEDQPAVFSPEPGAEKKPKPKRSSSRRKSTAQETKAAETKDALSGQSSGESKTADTAAAAEAAVARAEQKVDQWGYEIGRWASRLVARAREEAEDMVAEAQHIRRNGRS